MFPSPLTLTVNPESIAPIAGNAPLHAGMKYDMNNLLTKFKSLQSFRFTDFADEFKSMHFDMIYAGRQSAMEHVEFTDRLFRIAARYTSKTKEGPRPNNYCQGKPQTHFTELKYQPGEARDPIERVFGVYLCYSLYYVQPTDYHIPIKITPNHMGEIREFMKEYLVPQRCLDALGCLFKLVDDSAFEVVAFDTCYDPACHRFELSETDLEDDIPPEDQMPLLKGIVEDAALKQLSLVHQRYEEVKKKLNIKSPKGHFRTDLHKEFTKIHEDAVQNIEIQRKNLEAERRADALREHNKSQMKMDAYKSKIITARNRRYLDPDVLEKFSTQMQQNRVHTDSQGANPDSEEWFSYDDEENPSDDMEEPPALSREGEPPKKPGNSSHLEVMQDSALNADELDEETRRLVGIPKKFRAPPKIKEHPIITSLDAPSTSKAIYIEPSMSTKSVQTVPPRPVLDPEFEKMMANIAKDTPTEKANQKKLKKLLEESKDL